jgi:hypothetical protein
MRPDSRGRWLRLTEGANCWPARHTAGAAAASRAVDESSERDLPLSFLAPFAPFAPDKPNRTAHAQEHYLLFASNRLHVDQTGS